MEAMLVPMVSYFSNCISLALHLSIAKAFKIITGRGAHSAKLVSVLKPAIKKALLDDGWNISACDAGIIVRGKRN